MDIPGTAISYTKVKYSKCPHSSHSELNQPTEQQIKVLIIHYEGRPNTALWHYNWPWNLLKHNNKQQYEMYVYYSNICQYINAQQISNSTVVVKLNIIS